MDKLKVIFDKQEAFQESLGTIFDNFTEEERANFILRHSVYLDQEIQEALYEMPFFKDWKDYSAMDEDSRAIAWQKVRMELVDALHFFVNLCIAAGHTPETLFHMYTAKNKENYRRQDEGYSYDKLYRDQTVEDVMSILSGVDNTMPTCAVSTDDGIMFSDDFIAVMSKPSGEAHMYYNADVITLGLAARMIDSAYYAALGGYPLEEQLRIKEAVEGDLYE